MTLPRSLRLAAAVLCVAFAAHADVPRLRLAQYGRLLDLQDRPVDGQVRLTVRLWSDKVPGSVADRLLWEDEYAVLVSGGFYSLELGGQEPLEASVLEGGVVFMSMAIDDGPELLPRLSLGPVPAAVHASTADRALVADLATLAESAGSADAVRWSGGEVALDESGRWPAHALALPDSVVHVGDDGRIAESVLPAKVPLLDSSGRIPLDALPSGPSGLDSASVGGHTPDDAAMGDRRLALRDAGGRLHADTVGGVGVSTAPLGGHLLPLDADRKLPLDVLPSGIDAATVGGVAVSTTPAAGALLPLGENGRLPHAVLPETIDATTVGGVSVSGTPAAGALLPLDADGKVPAAALPAGLVTTGSSPSFESVTTTAGATVGGALRIGYAGETCDEVNDGLLRFADRKLEICASGRWSVLATTLPGLVEESGVRRWSDGTVAKSCREYLNPTDGHRYDGATGSGLYAIRPASTVLTAYCDMTTDGGGWTLVFKWKSNNIPHPSGSNSTYNYFPQLVTGADSPSTAPTGAPGGDTEGFASATRNAIWTGTGATTYRMTAYTGANAVFLDVKKDTNLDSGNVSFCAVAGVSCTDGYGNATAGNVTVIGGSAATAGSVHALYQLGAYGCNCWEGQWLGHWQTNLRLFGDCYDQGYPTAATVAHTAFWVR